MKKRYCVPVTWEVYANVEVEANSVDEAIEIVKLDKGDIALPTDPDYVDGSFGLASEDLEEVRYMVKEA